jgi:hypothetical protein
MEIVLHIYNYGVHYIVEEPMSANEKPMVENFLKNMNLEAALAKTLKNSIEEVMKERVKSYINDRINAEPEISKDIEKAVGDMLKARAELAASQLRLALALGKLGWQIAPEEVTSSLLESFAPLVSKFAMKQSITP